MKSGRRPATTRRKLRPGRRKGDDDDDYDDLEEQRPRGIALHWYIISLSILLVVGLSFISFMALPDVRAHSLLSAVLIRRRAAISGDPHSEDHDGGSDEERIALLKAAEEALAIPLPLLPKASSAERGLQQQHAHDQFSMLSSLAGRSKSAAGTLAGARTESASIASLGGIALFSGETWYQLHAPADADEVTFGTWIYLPHVQDVLFPSSSESMKTIAATKVSGCASAGDYAPGWAFFVHEWSTTNRQLRLSWTDGATGCNEVFSTTALVPYDKWVQVGFSFSKANNRVTVALDKSVVIDNKLGLGSYVRGGQTSRISQVNVKERSVSHKSSFILGAHTHIDGGDYVQSHAFVGFMGDVRLFTTALDALNMVQILSASYEELRASGSDSALKVLVQFREGEASPINSASTGRTSEEDRLEGKSVTGGGVLPILAWSDKPKHPILQSAVANSASFEALPILDPAELRKSFPKEWLARFSEDELLKSQEDANPWAEEVRAAMFHTWSGYRQKAWGQDDISPSRGNGKNWCKMAVTMLDGVSTLWLMGFKAEFEEAASWLEKNPLPSPGGHGMHSLFEITIRALGGLCSAHSLSGKSVFLETAKRLADKLLGAFNTQSGIPRSTVDIGTGAAASHTWMPNIVLAEATTLQVEFRYLSHATGDRKYADAVDKAMNAVLRAAAGRGLVPIYISANAAPQFTGSKMSMGAMGDSYYEYLLKQWIQTGRKEDRFKDTWIKAMNEMMDNMVVRTAGGLRFLAELENGQKRMRMDHLACFVAGMLMLGSRTLPKNEVDPRWEPFAADLTRTCYEMYVRAPSGLSPEYVHFNVNGGEGHDMSIPGDAPHNLLRPEAAEAIYYMWYYTGDPKYRAWAHQMFVPFTKYAKARFGFSAVADVRLVPPPQRDSQESFWLAETLKYFYLIFAPRSTISLEEWVFNTEAQPMRIWGV